jgi:hypothetical protein
MYLRGEIQQISVAKIKNLLNYFISSIDLILPDALGPGIHSAFNINEYQKQENNVSGEQSAAGA